MLKCAASSRQVEYKVFRFFGGERLFFLIEPRILIEIILQSQKPGIDTKQMSQTSPEAIKCFDCDPDASEVRRLFVEIFKRQGHTLGVEFDYRTPGTKSSPENDSKVPEAEGGGRCDHQGA